MAQEKQFAEGIFFNEKRDGAPDFVLGGVSIQRQMFIEWLNNQDVNDKGYLKLDFKMGKSGKAYAELNTWQPNR
jgi:hypothetical protein